MTAIVPVGLTRYRENLYPLVPYNKETAGQTIDIIEKWVMSASKARQTNFLSG